MREQSDREATTASILPAVSCTKDGSLPSCETAWIASELSTRAENVLDSGATKTVIGSQLVGNLINALHPKVKNKVYRSHCEVTFRFGNLNTLEARHALVIPIGPVNLHIAIVPGSTPFLISNTLMRALKAIVNTHTQELYSPCFKEPIPLKLSPRGLFLLDINELVNASVCVPQLSKCQDTFVAEAEKQLPSPTAKSSEHHSEVTEPDDKVVSESDITDRTLNHAMDNVDLTDKTVEHRADSKIDGRTVSFENDSKENSKKDPQMTPVSERSADFTDDGLAIQDQSSIPSTEFSCRPFVDSNHGQQQQQPGAEAATPPCSSGRAPNRGLVEVQSASTAKHGCGLREHSPRQKLCHHVEGPSRLGQMVPPTLRQQLEGQPPSHRALLSVGDREMRTGGRSNPIDGCTQQSTTPTGTFNESQSQSSGKDASSTCGTKTGEPRSSIGAGPLDGGVQLGASGSCCNRGSRERSGPQLCGSDSGDHQPIGPDECHRESSEPGSGSSAECTAVGRELNLSVDYLNLHAGDIDGLANIEECNVVQEVGVETDVQYFRGLIQKYSKELHDLAPSKPHNRSTHDLFEVFCGPESQLTHQCVCLSGQAQRFSRDRCDLQSKDGRSILFTELHHCHPRHVWFAPICKPWCAFSNLNGSQSLEKWEELQESRRRHLEQLALGIVIYRFQQKHGNHLHWEQPRGSLMLKLPLLKELYEGTSSAELDMCQFGLQDPQSMEPIRKGMVIMTTSKMIYQHLHGRTCQGTHDHHQRIEGTTKIDGNRILRSQFSENYPRKFARSIAIQLLKKPNDDHIKTDCFVSLARSLDIGVDDRLRKKPRLSMFRAKSEASRVSEPSTTEPAKRRRMEVKQHPPSLDQDWKSIFEKCSPLVARVGKKVIEDPDLIKEIQNLIEDKTVCFIVAGRGTDRTMPPCKETVPGEAPFRKSVFVHRISNKLLIEDEWESWENLSKRQLVRSSHPCKFCKTIFARNPDDMPAEPSEKANNRPESTAADPDNLVQVANSPERSEPSEATNPNASEPMVLGPIQKVDASSTSHGPKFLCLPKEHQQSIIKAHTNLGHPSPERLKMLFRQQGVDASIIDGVDDLRCSVCAMQSRPKASRTATIRTALDFNDRIAVDGLTFTNQKGQVFHLYHIIDLGTSFHTAIIAPSRTSENAIHDPNMAVLGRCSHRTCHWFCIWTEQWKFYEFPSTI